MGSASLESSGTSASASEPLWFSDHEWSDDLENTFARLIRPALTALHRAAVSKRREVRYLERLAIDLDHDRRTGWSATPVASISQMAELARERARVARSAAWYESRASSLGMPRRAVVGACRQRWRSVACGCDRLEVQVGCDQPLLCRYCRRKHSRRWASRITAGLDHAVRDARRAYLATPRHRRRGTLPGVYLVTLTGPHSGDVAHDRARMARALRRLTKHAAANAWWSAYAATWEITPGSDGQGHVHVHLAAVSGWIPYSSEQASGERGLHEAWREYLPGAEVLDVSPPKPRADNARSAGEYLSKYVTKGVETGDFTGQKAAEILVAFRNKRKVHTSVDFWRPRHSTCRRCSSAWSLLEAPCSLRELLPGAWLSSAASRTRWGDPSRARSQKTLLLS